MNPLPFSFAILALCSAAVSQQANTQDATLLVNGHGAPQYYGGSGPGAGVGPHLNVVNPGGNISLQFLGPPTCPVMLFAGPLNLSASDLGCIGLVDIGTPPVFYDLIPVIDGVHSLLGQALFHTNFTGELLLNTLTWNMPVGVSVALQGLILQPASATCPLLLTAAHIIDTQ